MDKIIFNSIFFLSFLICTTVLADVKYFSATGKEISKEEYERITTEKQNRSDPVSKNQKIKNEKPDSDRQDKIDIYPEKSISKTSKSNSKCKGILSFDNYGSYVFYPPSCDPNGEKTLNSCFDICEAEKEEKFNELANRPIHGNNEWGNSLQKLQKEWDKCVKNCRKRVGLDL